MFTFIMISLWYLYNNLLYYNIINFHLKNEIKNDFFQNRLKIQSIKNGLRYKINLLSYALLFCPTILQKLVSFCNNFYPNKKNL